MFISKRTKGLAIILVLTMLFQIMLSMVKDSRLMDVFISQSSVSSLAFAQEITGNEFGIEGINVLTDVENVDNEKFTVDSVRVYRGDALPATLIVSIYQDNKLVKIKLFPIETGEGSIEIKDIDLTQDGFVTDYTIKAFVFDNIHNPKPKARSFIYNLRNPAVISEVSPSSGTFGNTITIKGQGFTLSNDLNNVYFIEKSTGQKLPAQVIECNRDYIKVIAPVSNPGEHDIYVEIQGTRSNAVSFTAIEMLEPTGNEAADLLSMSNTLLSTTNEISDIFGTSGLEEQKKNELLSLLSSSDLKLSDADNAYSELSEDAKQLINSVLANSEMPRILGDLNNDNEQLSGQILLMNYSGNNFSTVEALDRVDETRENVKEARNTLRTINTTLKILSATLAVTGAGLFLSGGAGGDAAIALATEMDSFRRTFIVPVLEVLEVVYTVLSVTMTSATAGSLEFTYHDDVHIDQYFSKMTDVPDISQSDESVRIRLLLISQWIEDLPYYRDILDATPELNIYNHSTNRNYRLNKDLFKGIRDNTYKYYEYLSIYNELVLEQNGEVKQVNELVQNASEILKRLRFYRSISRDLKSKAQGNLSTIEYYKSIAMIENSFPDELYYTIKYSLEDVIDIANKIDATTNVLIRDFEKPEELTEEEIIPEYKGFKDEDGVLLVGQNYYLYGTMDFNVGIDRAKAIDSMLSGIEAQVGEFIANLVGLDLQLEDVPVRLKCESSDETIIKSSWSDVTGLKIMPIKPGIATLTIYPNISYIIETGKIEKEYLSIIKEFEVVSGDYTSENYNPDNQLGPRIDAIKDDEGLEIVDSYLGENINILGKGFSSLPRLFQNIYMAGVPHLDVDKLIPQFYYADRYKEGGAKFKRENITLETPDTLSGYSNVAVGLNQKGENVLPNDRDKWLSNSVWVNILAPVIDYMPPNLIKGESYPVIGRGFSHTPRFNKIIFDNDEKEYNQTNENYFSIVEPDISTPFAQPTVYEVVNKDNHDILHRLHNRLTFITPNDAVNSNSNHIKALENNDMKINANGSIIKHFNEPLTISNVDNIAIRPSIAYDADTDKKIAMWIDQNAQSGSILLASFIDENGVMSDTHIVADNLGSIETAPDRVAVYAIEGKIFAAYVGKDNNNNDDIFVIEHDGMAWGRPKNISLSDSSSIKPAIIAGDFDNDGDIDALLLYIENTGETSSLYGTILSHNVITGYSPVFKAALFQYSDTTPAIFYENGNIVGAFNKYNENASDIYVSKLNISGTNDTLAISINPIKVSDNSGYVKAKNPTVVSVQSPIDNKQRICVAWENTVYHEMDYSSMLREDIFMATIEEDDGNNLVKLTNLTNSIKHSQGPILSKDSDNIIALGFIQQGYEEASSVREQAFNSSIYFTRSFDGGLNFQRPYLNINNETNGIKLSHIAMVNEGDARITMMWQQGDEVKLINTGVAVTPPINHIENSKIPRKEALIYATGNGNYYLSDESGNYIRSIYKKDSSLFYSYHNKNKLAVSPSGRFVAIPSDWVKIADADGAFPIDICLPDISEKDFTKHIIWSDDENKLSVTFVEFGVVNISPKGVINGYVSDISSVEGRTHTFTYTDAINDEYFYGLEWYSGNDMHMDYYLSKNYGESSEIILFSPNEMLGYSSDCNAVLFNDKLVSTEETGFCVMFVNGGRIQIDEEHAILATFSPDNSKIAYYKADGLYIYDIETKTKKLINHLDMIQTNQYHNMAFTKDGSKIILEYFGSDLEYVTVGIETGQTTDSKGIVNDYINLGENIILISNYATLPINNGVDTVLISLSQKPMNSVTLVPEVPVGVIVAQESLVFTPENFDVPQELTIITTQDAEVGLSFITLFAQSSDPAYNDVNGRILVLTYEVGSFTAGKGFLESAFTDNEVYPSVYNWSRQSQFSISKTIENLWQQQVDDQLSYDEIIHFKIIADYQDNVRVNKHMFDINGNLISTDELHDNFNHSVVVGDQVFNKVFFADRYEHPFFVDSEMAVYRTGMATRNYYLSKEKQDGTTHSIVIGDRNDDYIQSIPVITKDGKIIVHHFDYAGVYNADDLELIDWLSDFDSVPNIVAADNNNSGYSLFFGTKKDEVNNSFILKAVSSMNFSNVWAKTFNNAISINTDPALNREGIMYVPIGTRLYAINTNTGMTIWAYETDKYIGGTPIVDADGKVVFTAGTDLIILNPNGTCFFRKNYAENSEPDKYFTGNVVIGSKGQIYFGCGEAGEYIPDFPLFCVGANSVNPKANTVHILEDSITVDEDCGDVYLTVIDDTPGDKGGFSADIMLVPETADSSHYSLDWTHTGRKIVFEPGESQKHIKINIFDSFIIEPSRSFKVRLSQINTNKALNTDSTTIVINDITLPDDEKCLYSFVSRSTLIKENEQKEIQVRREPNQNGQYPAIAIKILVENPWEDPNFPSAVYGSDFTLLPQPVNSANGNILTLTFGEGEAAKSITMNALENILENSMKKIDFRILFNSAMEMDYSLPSQITAYIADSDFEVPSAIVKVYPDEAKISNIMFWGYFEVFNPQGEVVHSGTGYVNDLYYEYSIGGLEVGDGYKVRSYFADAYTDTYFDVLDFN